MRARTRWAVPLAAAVVCLLAGCAQPAATPAPSSRPGPHATQSAPDHIVVVVMENKDRTSVLGSRSAPYLTALAGQGANMVESYGVTHPSQPNYLALFSGSQQGVTSNTCPLKFPTAPNLGRQLLDSGRTFVGYSESLPGVGFTGCTAASDTYRRKHSPWVNFGNLPAAVNQPFSAFPSDYTTLPTVAFVTPNMCHDMHDCSVATGDAWVRDQLDGYAQWAKTHNSWLVVTFDENAGGTVNQIATLLVGEGIKPGVYTEQLNHYGLLRTIEDVYGLPPLGHAAEARSLQTIWTGSAPRAPTGVVNSSFERGLSDWVREGSTAATRSSRHGGTLVGRTGSAKARRGYSVLSQTFVAPVGSSQVRVSWLGRCRDTVDKAWATILLRHDASNQVVRMLKRTCVAGGSWRTVSAPLTEGHSYTLILVSRDDGKKATPNRTYFDDVVIS